MDIKIKKGAKAPFFVLSSPSPWRRWWRTWTCSWIWTWTSGSPGITWSARTWTSGWCWIARTRWSIIIWRGTNGWSVRRGWIGSWLSRRPGLSGCSILRCGVCSRCSLCWCSILNWCRRPCWSRWTRINGFILALNISINICISIIVLRPCTSSWLLIRRSISSSTLSVFGFIMRLCCWLCPGLCLRGYRSSIFSRLYLSSGLCLCSRFYSSRRILSYCR